MNKYIAMSDKGSIMDFKAASTYDAKHYVINYADHSELWTVRSVKEWIKAARGLK